MDNGQQPAFPVKILEKYAKDNGWELGGWHPNGEQIVGHFHRTHEILPYKLITKFIAFDKDGNMIKEVTDDAE